MDLKDVKSELKELRKRNQLVNNSVQIEELYKSRLTALSNRNMEDSHEYLTIQKTLEKLQTIEQLKGELALETKYFDIINNLPYTKKNIATKFFLEAKSTIKICNDMFMDQQVLYNELSKIYRIIYKEINKDERL